MKQGFLPVLLLLATVAPAHAQIGVSPPRFDLVLGDRPANESVRIFNFGTEPTQVRVSVYNWELDESNQVRLLPPTEQSLDQWMVINPLRFEIAAQDSQVVRFSLRPRVRPEPGEHRAMIYFEEDSGDTEPGRISLLYRMGIAVYGYVGAIERDGALEAVDADGSQIRLDVSSLGTAHVRLDGQYAIWPAGEYPGSDRTARIDDLADALPAGVLDAGRLPRTPVLPGTRRSLLVQLGRPLPAGDYVLDLNANLADDRIDRGVRFSIGADHQIALGARSGHE